MGFHMSAAFYQSQRATTSLSCGTELPGGAVPDRWSLPPLRDQFLNHTPSKLGKLLEPPRVEEGELVVIQAQQTQQRDVQVADVMHRVHGFGSSFIGGADGVSSLHAAAGEPDSHGLGIVIAAIG